MSTDSKRRPESDHGARPKPALTLIFSPVPLGQQCPQQSPAQYPESGSREPLGPPLSIREAAAVIGCSPWTIRQKLLPSGLPHFRVGRSGKLFFYKTQVIRWLMRQQEGDKEK